MMVQPYGPVLGLYWACYRLGSISRVQAQAPCVSIFLTMISAEGIVRLGGT